MTSICRSHRHHKRVVKMRKITVLVMFPLLVSVVALDHFLPDDEIVGLGEVARFKLALARAKIKHRMALAKLKPHKHLLLASNPNVVTGGDNLAQVDPVVQNPRDEDGGEDGSLKIERSGENASGSSVTKSENREKRESAGKKQTTKTSKSPKKLKVCTRVSFDDNVHSQSGKSNISVDVKKSDVTPDKSYTPMDRSATAEEYYLPDDILERPFLIQVPPNSPHFHFRSYRSALNGNFGASEKGKRSRLRRSLPMLRLLVDPNAKLDMSKTLENIGTVTKHAFEDERAPMYHVRDVVGSTKNTVLSFLRILPQEAIIPSQYKIVDRKRERSNVAETNRKPAKTSPETGLDDQFFDVVQKLGAMVKESVRAGQETFQHMNDVAHSARKVVATTRHSLPAVLLPYARTPVLQKKTSGKLTLLAPRFADVAENRRDGAELEYVSIGDVMDVFGVSDPNSKGVGLTKITIHPKLREGLQRPRLKSRFGENSLEEGAELAPNYFVTSEHLNGDDLDADEGGENGMEALGSRNGVEVTDHDKRNKNIMQLLVDLKDMLDVEEYVADDAAAISVEATTKISSNESTEGKNKKQRKQQQKFDRGHETNDSSGDVRQIGSKQCRKIGACKHRMLNKNKLKSADFS